MEKSTAELTEDYVKEHPNIKHCLKKGLINYSSLARLVAKELNIEKKSSKEAILIAARRFAQKLQKEVSHELEIKKLLSKSELDIKTKISVLICSKSGSQDFLGVGKDIQKQGGFFSVLEGSDNYTVIVQERFVKAIEDKTEVIKKNKDLALIIFKSPKEIYETHGVVSFLSSLFGENGVNIVEFLSSWTDTLFIIESKDLQKAISFLHF